MTAFDTEEDKLLTLVPDHEVKLRVRGVIAELERLATNQSASTASARRTRHRRPANG